VLRTFAAKRHIFFKSQERFSWQVPTSGKRAARVLGEPTALAAGLK